MRIVVVEDEHNTREGLVRLIGKIGIEDEVVGEAENGLDGIDVIERTKPDLVITDIKMPGMSGLIMLETLKSKGYAHKMIILTGYSEFEYAKKALKMSVSDYLEKPITVPDLIAALDKVRGELERSSAPEAEEQGNMDFLFARLMDPTGEDAKKHETSLRDRLGFNDDRPLCVAVFSFAMPQEKGISCYKEELAKRWRTIGAGGVFGMASRGALISVVQPANAVFDHAKFVEESLLPDFNHAGLTVACSFGEASGLSGLRKEVEALLEWAKWSMLIGNKRPIRREDAERLIKLELPYPAKLESKCLKAVVSANAIDIEQQFQSWVREFQEMKYGPVLTIEYSIRFVSYMLKLADELHAFRLPEPLQSSWQQSLRDIRSIQEYERGMNGIATALMGLGSPAGSPIHSLMIQKAVRMIQTGYAEGITLEEIADNLRVTTAYLSGQFNKEVGQPFSGYIRDLRLRKAKELLLGSDLRTFEIAQRVGYPDPKYFSRVFKEATGMTPGEYQKLNLR